MYFKAHQDSIKDGSTMRNALGYKFEKKKSFNEATGQKKSFNEAFYQKRISMK
jgi:hypothetical protein